MRLLTYVGLIALLTGCGELSYKQGGSQQEIDRAHQACRGSGDQLSACLAEHGWKKPKVDAFDPLFATIEATDNREATQTKSSPFIELSKDSIAKEESAAVAKKPQATAAKTAPTSVQAIPAKEPATEAAPHSTINDGPDVEYSINSWWKMGAFPEQLKRDQVACEKKLGPTYLPDYKTQTYKRAFVACMHESGWMAIRNINK
ncbi:hypothetical protein [Methylophilus sp. TWE2]|uniref:hypothetical protein n=1 Tax=Methylophilus sp. TWE2 TaxID=1662285 RepID=UPI000670831A|nr:hypothetical protein [Methylophilus sp. TWE2]AKR42743.1 hypothetical protein ACJ67_04390 [Methylophilus sp. TWE2]